MQDQCALSLFTMPTGEGLTEQARQYIELCRTKEIERLERRILSERRATELAKLEHERLLKERSYDGPRSRRGRGAAAATSLAVTIAPPCAPEAAIANAGAGTFFSSRRNVNFSFCFLISYKLASNPQWRPQWMLLVVMRFPAMVDLQFFAMLVIVLPPMVIDLRCLCTSGSSFRSLALALRFALIHVFFFAVLFSHSLPALLPLFSIFFFESHASLLLPSFVVSAHLRFFFQNYDPPFLCFRFSSLRSFFKNSDPSFVLFRLTSIWFFFSSFRSLFSPFLSGRFGFSFLKFRSFFLVPFQLSLVLVFFFRSLFYPVPFQLTLFFLFFLIPLFSYFISA